MRKFIRLKYLASVLVLISFLLMPFLVWSQDQPISPEEARNHIGKVKTVCGTVASANYATRSKGQPTFLNLDKPYPHQVFTVLIWGSDRSKFEKPPETLYSGKEICVTGMIQSYRGRPEIIVKEPSQVKIR
jgi:DNA/RNA endonuclease YhcR with UshA esterase domain